MVIAIIVLFVLLVILVGLRWFNEAVEEGYRKS